MSVLGILLAVVVAYVVVLGGVALVYSWLWLRDRRAAPPARRRQGRTRPGATAVPGAWGPVTGLALAAPRFIAMTDARTGVAHLNCLGRMSRALRGLFFRDGDHEPADP